MTCVFKNIHCSNVTVVKCKQLQMTTDHCHPLMNKLHFIYTDTLKHYVVTCKDELSTYQGC